MRMTPQVCPWWGGYFIDNRFRRWLHNPDELLSPYVQPGMTVMDVGCGMGFFAIPMARMVGETGRVIAVDLQPQMLEELASRARRAGVAERIALHRCAADQLGVADPVDFALAFAVIHEVSDYRATIQQIDNCLRFGGKLYIAEPRIHVPRKAFLATMEAARCTGFQIAEEPKVRWCRAAVLVKTR
jgi:ubiquinone/menaquinone biosynthesis C-methylase UbiE